MNTTNGKAAAFETLFREHYARVVRSLAFIAINRDEANDAAQEAFLQLYLKWNKVSGYDDPMAWVLRVAVNRLKDERRAFGRFTLLLSRLTSLGLAAAGADSWEPRADLLAAFKRLPVQQRTAASLYYLADLSVSEVADVMRISEGAVSSHLHRARESLKTLLEVSDDLS